MMTSETNHITKVCTKCEGEPQPLSNFSKFYRSDDGLQHICKSCKRIMDAEYRSKTQARKAELQKVWRISNPGGVAIPRERNVLSNEELKLAAREQSRKHYVENRARILAYAKNRYKNNPHVMNANTAKYRAAKIQAIPIWAELSHIKKLYEKSTRLSAMGIPTHVDHIVPLQGKTVCGLHCFANLQLLSPTENHSKSNKHIDLSYQ